MMGTALRGCADRFGLPRRVTLGRRAAIALVVLSYLAALDAPVLAGPHDAAKLSGHLVDHSGVVTCPIAGWPLPPCSQFVIQGETFRPYDLYIVLAHADSAAGVAGFKFRLFYDGVAGGGVDIFNWASCADISVGSMNFPASGGILEVGWSPANCRRTVVEPEGVHVVAGAFYLYAYSADVLMLAAPISPDLPITDCGGGTTVVEQGFATSCFGFGAGGSGHACNACIEPCVLDPVERATWGGIKRGYGRSGE